MKIGANNFVQFVLIVFKSLKNFAPSFKSQSLRSFEGTTFECQKFGKVEIQTQFGRKKPVVFEKIIFEKIFRCVASE